jgi:hypothetical protein
VLAVLWELRMQKSAFLLMLLLFTAGPAFAANWVQIYRDGSGGTSFIDTDSIQRQGHTVSLWSRYLFDRPRYLPGATEQIKFNQMRIKQTIDCQANTSAHLIVRLYDGEMEVGTAVARPPSPKQILPGGISERIKQSVCKNV